ncbi:hypothetical protein [Isoptericola sp. NPDC057191]|uniref:hypothetical protein n=1 Tax=Isoptericola sp. NPDC057191 TaxID=3346041 RepID=UPI003629B83A
MPFFPFSFFAVDRLRQRVGRALKYLTSNADADERDAPGLEGVGPRLWAASLAGEALWLGSYQNAYDLSDAQWSAITTHLSGYGNLPLMRPLDVATSQRRRLDDLTVEDVASASGCTSTQLRTSFGDVDQVLIAVVRQVHEDGSAEASPLQLHLDRHTLTMSLQGLEDERTITAVHRLYALAGVSPAPRPDIRARARGLRGINPRSFDHLELAAAALAIDGWQGSRDVPAFYPRSLPRAVVRELGRLARVPSS